MTDFSNILANFFRSETSTISEYKTLLKETAVQDEWLAAVALYRKGIFALQKNDFTGLDIIRQANESLKKVLDTSKETVSINMKALHESIETFKKENPEDLQLIKFNFGILYEDCKAMGMKAIVNEETFYEDESQPEALDEKIENADEAKKDAAEEKKLTEQIPSADSVKVESPVSTAPAVTPEPVTATATTPPVVPPQPVVPAETGTVTPEMKESGYGKGFEDGRSYIKGETASQVKFRNQFKESLNQKIEAELYEKPYSYVESYKKGFAAGCAMEEEVLKELHPDDWKKFEEERSK